MIICVQILRSTCNVWIMYSLFWSINDIFTSLFRNPLDWHLSEIMRISLTIFSTLLILLYSPILTYTLVVHYLNNYSWVKCFFEGKRNSLCIRNITGDVVLEEHIINSVLLNISEKTIISVKSKTFLVFKLLCSSRIVGGSAYIVLPDQESENNYLVLLYSYFIPYIIIYNKSNFIYRCNNWIMIIKNVEIIISELHLDMYTKSVSSCNFLSYQHIYISSDA